MVRLSNMGVLKSTKKPFKYDADVIVIGSGPGGSIAAHTLADENKRVIIIEEDKFGGKCPNYSCIPTKAFLEAAAAAKNAENAKKFGLTSKGHSLDFEETKHWVIKAVNNTGVNNSNLNYQDKNIGIVKGHAHFINPYTVSIGLRRLTAKKFIVAAGSSQSVPAIKGIQDIDYLTYKNILDLKKLPKSIAIIGGGSIAYEYSQIFSAFGVAVHVFEAKGHLFPSYDSEVSDLAESILASDGTRVHTQSKVESIKKSAKSLAIEHKNHGQTHKITVDAVFVASGHSPNTDIGLENALVKYTEDGIKVNSKMQTSQSHIYAIGDVTGESSNANSAFRQGQVAGHNISHRRKFNFSYHATPHVAWGIPEIASVGKTERQLRLTGKPYQTSIAPIGLVGRSFSTDYQSGFVKIVASHTGIVLGASIVAPHAGEFISELTFAVQHHRRACDIANTIHPFSSWSEAVRVAASKLYCI